MNVLPEYTIRFKSTRKFEWYSYFFGPMGMELNDFPVEAEDVRN
jgi:hypothetical protein